MRALTVRQPWAWAIINGGKDIENRSRNVAGGYRGPVAIHAGQAWDEDGLRNQVIGDAAMRVNPDKPAVCWFNGKVWRHDETLVRGAFIGVVDLVDVHEAHLEEHAYGDIWQAACCASPWRQYGATRAHLVLANPRPLPVPIPARGRLGLWTPPTDVVEQLQAVTR